MNIKLQCEVRATSLIKFKQLVEKLFPGDSFEDREMRFDMLENINCIEVSSDLFLHNADIISIGMGKT